MATLTAPITKQNIVDRFADYVRDTANSSLVWGDNATPFPEWTDTTLWGGGTGGKAIGINGTNIQSNANLEIAAQSVYDVLLAETAAYTRIRKYQAILFVDGAGGNTGSRPTAGEVFNQTSVANLSTTYLNSSGLAAARDNVYAGNVITSGGLEIMFSNMRQAYIERRDVSAGSTQVNVCHASCHSSCHGSRGRR